jgi:TPR repeat protein
MAEAQYALGMLYLGQGDVEGIKKDETKGLHWIRKAASKDHGASSRNASHLSLSPLSLRVPVC